MAAAAPQLSKEEREFVKQMEKKVQLLWHFDGSEMDRELFETILKTLDSSEKFAHFIESYFQVKHAEGEHNMWSQYMVIAVITGELMERYPHEVHDFL